MNLLIVDDQRAIVDGLKRGIDWQKYQIDHVYTACSAREARIIFLSIKVDILLSDIEMPEEDGLQLFRWVREESPATEGVFLTSHAEFDYAKEAIGLGSSDYILQPARYQDIEQAIEKVTFKIIKNNKLKYLEDTSRIVSDQRDALLENLILKFDRGEEYEAEQMLNNIQKIFGPEYECAVYYPLLVRITSWKKKFCTWDHQLTNFVLRNILEELLAEQKCRVSVAHLEDNMFLILLGMEKQEMVAGEFDRRLHIFGDFISKNMDFDLAIYRGEEVKEHFCRQLTQIRKYCQNHTADRAGVYLTEQEEISHTKDSEEDRINLAVRYIKANLNRTISRAEVASMLYLNEEYFSRLFRQETGFTFKDFEQKVRMEMAQSLLMNSKFSISIIASKVGYDNFSHFSKVFKRYTDLTPQEYRKIRQSGVQKKLS